MLSISIKATKFEDITVTFQPMKPSIPIIIITEVAQPSKGIITHLIFLKINQSVKTIKTNTPIPKTTISLLSLIFLMSCVSTQSNIKIDSIETFNLDNYNDFNIKINDTNLSAEVNPIVLEKFKENLKNSIEERGLSYNQNSDLIFDINFTTKDTVESDRMNHYYSRYYWDYYMYRDDLYTVTQNILRVNLKDLSQDKTVWTVVTVWRDGSSRSISYDDASNILVDEIMVSFL